MPPKIGPGLGQRTAGNSDEAEEGCERTGHRGAMTEMHSVSWNAGYLGFKIGEFARPKFSGTANVSFFYMRSDFGYCPP